MVDVIQVPVYSESILIYIILSALIFGFIALTIFILVFFRKDYKDMILKTARVEARVKGLDKSLAGAETLGEKFKKVEEQVEDEMEHIDQEMKHVETEAKRLETRAKEVDDRIRTIGIQTKNYAKNLDRKVGRDMDMIRRFVVSGRKDDERLIRTVVQENTKELDDEISSMKDEMKKMQNNMKKGYKDIAMFFIYNIFEDLSAETNEAKINKKLDDLRLFVKLSKKNKQWGDPLQKETSKFLKNMEKRWRSKSKDIAMLYSMSLEEL